MRQLWLEKDGKNPDVIKVAGNTQKKTKMWATLQKKVDLDDQCHSLIRCLLDVLSEQHKSIT